MNIRIVRRISQVFFFLLFLWFCVVNTIGTAWWQLRGWPINWLLQLDPLIAIGTLFTTGKIFGGLLWALATVVLTILLGRFFCGWVCPFGTLHQAVAFLSRRTKKFRERVALNQYWPAQSTKYYILIFMLAAALGKWAFGGTLFTGLLDPIPLFHRTINLAVLPIINLPAISPAPRFYTGAWIIGGIAIALVALNIVVPRFFCRALCPLGALFGWMGRFAIWRIGKVESSCAACERCEHNCEGACNPFGKVRTNECLLCMNCLDPCPQAKMAYQTAPSAAGEIASPQVSRRGFLVAAISGLAVPPLLRTGALTGPNWPAQLIRPPGALAEPDFLDRCIKCGQCMRVCPTNIIQPAGFQAGIEGLWTPILNYRIGTSGCQLNCVACGNVCPTAAIRPLTLDEKLGRNDSKEQGPIRMGTAFFDHGRCLPWAMDKPCIVCQENCPVSPKAIFLREVFVIVRDATLPVKAATADSVELSVPALKPEHFGTGDYFCRTVNSDESTRRRIKANTESTIAISGSWTQVPEPNTAVWIEVRLQRPQVDPEHCIGCGVCEHECPISGLRGVRVTAENETRNRKHRMIL